ncbi:MAG: maleylpyruvate isomerase N-terminal domain-containing protein [Cellulomonas sp.]
MTPRMPRADLTTTSRLLAAQWATLRTWLGWLLDDDPAEDGLWSVPASPSVLPGLTVAELIAHVGRAMDALAATRLAEPGTVPLTLAEYLGTYPERATEIAHLTREIALEIEPAPLRAVDAMAAAAFARLAELGPEDCVVQARRAPITLSDMVVSRLIELVVHADDLARSVPARPGERPVDAGALDQVAEALLGIVVARGGWSLEIADPLIWVRLATGRTPYDVDQLSRALRPSYTSDSVPDLKAMLPLV